VGLISLVGLISVLRGAEHVVALTGSGISAKSGVPTFREAQTGLWPRFHPHKLATPKAFARDPRLVLEWYEWRRKLAAEAEPGHKALAELERRIPGFTLVTQNVDGLHAKAASQTMIELHGNILRSKCSLEGEVASRKNTTIPSLHAVLGMARCSGPTWCGSVRCCRPARSRRPRRRHAGALCSSR
jgi:NAD-dependent SIR2 family protein deacetylase